MENDNNITPVSKSPGRVMDIHARRPQPSVRSVASESNESEPVPVIVDDTTDQNLPGFEMTEVTDIEEPQEIQANQPSQPSDSVTDDQTSEQIDVQPDAPALTEAKDESSETDEQSDQNDQEPQEAEPNNPLAIPPRPIKKRSTPIVALLISLIIALGIGALVVYVFSKKQNPPAVTSKIDTSASTPRVTGADVDATTKKVDDSLKKLDDSKEFPDTDVSTQTVGF